MRKIKMNFNQWLKANKMEIMEYERKHDYYNMLKSAFLYKEQEVEELKEEIERLKNQNK